MADPWLVAQGEDTAARVLTWVQEDMKTSRVAPSFREIAAGTGLSLPGVQAALRRLEDAGKLHVLPSRPRGVRLGPRQTP